MGDNDKTDDVKTTENKGSDLKRLVVKPCPFCGSMATMPEKVPPAGFWEICCSVYCIRMTRKTKREVIRDWKERAL